MPWDAVGTAARVFSSSTYVLVVGLTIGLGSCGLATSEGIYRSLTNAEAGPSKLVHVHAVSGGQRRISHDEYVLIEQNRGEVFSNVAAFDASLLRISSEYASTRGLVEFVSQEYFDVFEVSARTGRLLNRSDTKGECVAVVSEQLKTLLWRGADPLGAEVTLNGALCTVVGVVPESFRGGLAPSVVRTQAFAPLAARRVVHRDESLSPWLSVRASLNPGHFAPQAAAYLNGLMSSVPTWQGKLLVDPSEDVLVHESIQSVTTQAGPVLVLVTAVILMLACLNVAAYQSARNFARRGEMAVRAACGAGPSAILAELALEGGLAALAAIPVTLTLSAFAGQSIRLAMPAVVGLDLELIPVSPLSSLAACLTIAAASCIGFAGWPALVGSRRPPLESLSAGAIVRRDSGSRSRALLVVAHAGGTMLLVVVALGSYSRWQEAEPPDIDSHSRTIVAEIVSGGDGQSISHTWRQLSNVFGAAGVAVVDQIPFHCHQGLLPGTNTRACLVAVSPEYFEMNDLAPLFGRKFSDDEQGRDDVAVVSETVASALAVAKRPAGYVEVPGGRPGSTRQLRIEGVVTDEPRAKRDRSRGMVYVPIEVENLASATLLVRVDDVSSSLSTVERIVRSHWPRIDANRIEPLSRIVEVYNWPNRAAATILAGVAALACLLGGVGLFGTVSAAVSSRVPEFGIRLSAGATPRRLHWNAVAEVVRLVGAGQIGALLVAVAALRGLRVPPTSELVLMIGACSLTILGVAAAVGFFAARPVLHRQPLDLIREAQP